MSCFNNSANLFIISLFILFQLSQNEKLFVLDNLWSLNSDYYFPKSGPRNLKFQYNCLHQFKWLQYLKEQDGSYCRICVLFSQNTGVGKGSHQVIGKLVTTKFNNWKKQQVLKANSNYMQTLIITKLVNININNHFLAVKKNKIDSVEVQVNTAPKKEIEKNKK